VSRSRRRSVVDRRIRLLLVVLVLALAASLGRAVWLQAVRAEPLARMAASQHRETIEIPARRGTIYDRTGALLALGESATTVYADPRRVRDPVAAARAAGEILGKDPDALLAALSDRTRGFVYLARQADPAKAAALAKLELDGIGFYAEERRAYPQRTVSRSTVSAFAWMWWSIVRWTSRPSRSGCDSSTSIARPNGSLTIVLLPALPARTPSSACSTPARPALSTPA